MLNESRWCQLYEEAHRCVGTLHYARQMPIDGIEQCSGTATAFVVDAARGILLTCYHSIGSGPWTGRIVFPNLEEGGQLLVPGPKKLTSYQCDVYPLDPEPEHDGTFLKFEPSALRQKPAELALRPQALQSGKQVLMVGSAQGEQLTAHSGVVGQIDRNPDSSDPDESNINMIQISTRAGSGASGSPILDEEGFVIGLHCWAWKESAVSFALTIGKAQRILNSLQKGEKFSRGTIQTIWASKSFQKCRDLGLSESLAKRLEESKLDRKGMLVVEKVIPGGPAAKALKVGDILVEVNGNVTDSFDEMDNHLGACVGQNVHLLLHRAGKDEHVCLTVQDSYAQSCSQIVEAFGAIFQNVSFRLARLHTIPVKGVFLCEAGPLLRQHSVPSSAIVDCINGREVCDIEVLTEILTNIIDQEEVRLRYRSVDDLHTQKFAVFRADRHWRPNLVVYRWSSDSWNWRLEQVEVPRAPMAPTPSSTGVIPNYGITDPVGTKLLGSLVKVSNYRPFPVDHSADISSEALGLLVDKDMGYVLASMPAIPDEISDVSVTVADNVEVQTHNVLSHWIHGLRVVRYEPYLVNAPTCSAKVSAEEIKQGEMVMFVGWNNDKTMVATRAVVTDCSPFEINVEDRPRYRPLFVKAITIDSIIATNCASGILTDFSGGVCGIWANWGTKDRPLHFAIPTNRILPTIQKLRRGNTPDCRILNFDAQRISMAECRQWGITQPQIDKFEQVSPSRSEAFMVSRLHADPTRSSPEPDRVSEGDIFLQLHDHVITDVTDFDCGDDHEEIRALVFRQGREVPVRVRTWPAAIFEVAHMVIFAGAILQPPHYAVRQQLKVLPSDIYVASVATGSHADYIDMKAQFLITELNHAPVQQLEDLMSALKNLRKDENIALTAISLDGNRTSHHVFKRTWLLGPIAEYCNQHGWKVTQFPT